MAGLTGWVGLLERAIGYGLRSVEAVEPAFLYRPTPCAEWNLRDLLLHLNDSISVLQQGVYFGRVGLEPSRDGEAGEYAYGDGEPAAELVAVFRARAQRLLRTWSETWREDQRIAVDGHLMAAELMAAAAVVEISVHGWDVSAACGDPRPIPEPLARDALVVSRLVVGGIPRPPLYAPALSVSPAACSSDRLLAFLGRAPDGVAYDAA